MIKKLISKLKKLNGLLNNAEKLKRIQIDTYCSNLLKNLQGNFYLPHTGMSLSPYALSYLLNEIVINERRSIIEFGSGISTILMARLAAMNNIELKIKSVDDDKKWIKKLEEFLFKENLTKYVTFIYAPLVIGKNNYEWYDESILEKYCQNEKFDLILIDGPKAYLEGKEESRYGAIPYIYLKLSNNFVIFLDDANRDGEKKIINRWENEFDTKFIIENNLAITYRGKFFFSNPV